MRYLRTGRLEFDRESGTYLGHPTHGLARELVIGLKEKAIYSGELLRVLSLAAHEDRVFPMVRKLTLMLLDKRRAYYYEGTSESDNDSDGDAVDPATVETNVSAFLEQLKHMVPLVSDIGVQRHAIGNACNIDSRYFFGFISRFFRPASRISFNGICGLSVPMGPHLDELSNLVHINYDGHIFDGSFLRLIRRNAQTLQSLGVDLSGLADDSGLIQDPDDGRYVTYPRLLRLRLELSGGSSKWGQLSFKGAVPFPCLRQLHFPHACALKDDTLFRGNAVTLESLFVVLNAQTIDMLLEHKVFTPTSHPKLQHVDISVYAPLRSAKYYSFALSIGLGAPVRAISVRSTVEELLLALSPPGNFTCVQVLKLGHLKLNLWHVLSLVKALPLLSDLHVTPGPLHAMPAGMTKVELPAHIISTYAPMGPRFRCWHIEYVYNKDIPDLLVSGLLLALACPNFDYVVPMQDYHESFMKDMEEKIHSEEFRQYAPRLQRLLSH